MCLAPTAMSNTVLCGVFPCTNRNRPPIPTTKKDPMTACYIDSSFPSLLYYAAKYGQDDPEQALLRSTNAGGENVARGALVTYHAC